MIVLSKDKILEDYFIDQNAVITDKNGNVQHQYLYRGRYLFKGFKVHQILMYTFFGYKDGKEWNIHHLDENKLNNKLSNLVYITRAEHARLHKKGEKNHNYGKHWKLSAETKAKMSAARLGKKRSPFSEEHKAKIRANHVGMLGQLHSAESRAKMSAAKKGLNFFNNGIKNVRAKECPQGFKPGIIKRVKV